jgi:hypothetical protein
MALIYGDPLLNPTLSGKLHAKNQTLVGTDNQNNFIIGDVDNIMHDAKGGNDVLIGGSNSSSTFVVNLLLGDARFTIDNAKGGSDYLIGGSSSGSGFTANDLFGDAQHLQEAAQLGSFAQGGNDVLIGGSNSGSGTLMNHLWGDAENMFYEAQGGNDVLIGGDSTGSGVVGNGLVGDASNVLFRVQGGNDTLIAGTHSGGGSTVVNNMWGDWAHDLTGGQPVALPGHDTFVFNGNFGNQTYVHDFHQGEDLIDIVAAHGLGLDALTITQSGSDTLVHLTSDPNDVITLVGFTGTLTQSDFLGLMV